MSDKIDFAGAWFDVCNEYLCDREAFLKGLKNPVGGGMVLSAVADSVNSPPCGADSLHQSDSLDDVLVKENLDDFAQKGIAGDSHSKG